MYQLITRQNDLPVDSDHETFNQAMTVLLDYIEYWQTHHRNYINCRILRIDSEIEKTVVCSYNSVDGWLDVD